MNIHKLAYGISDDRFFADNFDIELDNKFDELTIRSKFDIELILGCSVVITFKVLSLDQILVKFGNDYGDHMNLVYAVEVFDMDKFVSWLIRSLMDFAYQSRESK